MNPLESLHEITGITIFRKKFENAKVFGEKCRKPCKKGLKKKKGF